MAILHMPQASWHVFAHIELCEAWFGWFFAIKALSNVQREQRVKRWLICADKRKLLINQTKFIIVGKEKNPLNIKTFAMLCYLYAHVSLCSPSYPQYQRVHDHDPCWMKPPHVEFLPTLLTFHLPTLSHSHLRSIYYQAASFLHRLQ